MSNTNRTANIHGHNREGWLTAFLHEVAPVIRQRTGLKVPLNDIRVSCSFPRTRSTPNRKGGYTTGVCMHGSSHKSGIHELFVNPLKANVLPTLLDEHGAGKDQGVGDILIHEILHACLDAKVMHKAKFARAAKAMGLTGKPTSTLAGPEAIKIIKSIIEKIGEYPHEALEGEWGKKQTTRLLKVMCTDCGYVNEAGNGYTARITMTWIENAGLPTCPCGAVMTLMQGDDDDKTMLALKPVESSATYRVPNADGTGYDDRFQIRRTSSEHFGERWSVIDLGERFRKVVIDGEERPVLNMESQARIIAADSKLNALELIDAVREGLLTWDEHESSFDLDEDVDLGEVPEDDYAAEFAKGLFHDVDEDEGLDNPEDASPEGEVLRMRKNGRWVEVPVEFDYDAEDARRVASGARKSEQIASGAEAAMD